jgi:hypothetical protein
VPAATPIAVTAASAVATAVPSVLAQDDGGGTLFLGEDFFPWMVLAFGAAMVVGNVLALVRPPQDRPGGPPPLARSVVMIVLGVVGAVWGIASLVA